MKPTFFLGGILVSAVDCTMLVGTARYLSRLACAAASDVWSTGVVPDAVAVSAASPHAAGPSMSTAAAAAASPRDSLCMCAPLRMREEGVRRGVLGRLRL